MKKLIITGNQQLGGEIAVHGSKNAVLPILAATLLVEGETVLHNVPNLSDVAASVEILKHLGAGVRREKNTLIIGDNELAENKGRLKNMETGEQTDVTLDTIGNYL